MNEPIRWTYTPKMPTMAFLPGSGRDLFVPKMLTGEVDWLSMLANAGLLYYSAAIGSRVAGPLGAVAGFYLPGLLARYLGIFAHDATE